MLYIAAVISGVVVGYVNGLIIARLEIPSFIATLGTQFFWSGMATVLSGGRSYALRGHVPDVVHLHYAPHAHDVIFGNELEAARWLSTQSQDFEGRTPLQDFINQGPDHALQVLGKIEHGIFF